MEDCTLAKKATINTLIYVLELNENVDVVYKGNMVTCRGDTFNTRSWKEFEGFHTEKHAQYLQFGTKLGVNLKQQEKSHVPQQNQL